MSSADVEPKKNGDARRSNRRPRRVKTEGAAPKKVTEAAATVEPVENAKTVQKPIIETAPIPAASVGNVVSGRISDIIRRGKGRFGFINLGSNSKPQEDVPRIYFRLSDYTDDEYPARRGYFVNLTVNVDEQDRYFAANVALTPEGKAAAAEEKAARDESKSRARPAKSAEGAEAKAGVVDSAEPKKEKSRRRNRRQRKEDETVISLKAVFDGKSDVKDISVKLGKPLGFLKRELAALFEEPGSFSMFCDITDANPSGTFLTKKLLKSCKEGDIIYLIASPEEEKA